MKTRAISLASTLSYIGSTGSGSVSGYYTIWTARINERNELLGQPTPRKINQTLADLKKFRGALWVDNPIGFDGDLIQVQVRFCEDCEDYQFFYDGICEVCREKKRGKKND